MIDNMQKYREDILDTKIKTVLGKEFPLPENVNGAKEEAFARIRAMGCEKQNGGADKTVSIRRRRNYFWKTCAGFTAAAAAFSVVCITNPAFAAKIPLVGHVFEQIGESLGFSGNYEKYAKTVEVPEEIQTAEITEEAGGAETGYRQSSNGLDITLSETYCSTSALYMSLILESEEAFPDTLIDQDGKPIVNLYYGTLKTDFSDQESLVYGRLDGKFIDDHTFAGILRYDLAECAYQEEDGTIIVPEIPDSFHAILKIPQIVGVKAVSTKPEMPEDIRASYEAAMKENGLGLTDEDYQGFTEEQKDIEHQLFSEMMNAYDQRYPEAIQFPNEYENWWVDGNWEFAFDVSRDERDTVTVEIGDVDENGLGLVSVTKTPFEITIKDGQNPDTFTVALDAQGDILPYGGAGDANTYAVQDRDVSTIDVYICDYVEYMDELKGYYWAEDYQEKKKTKTFKELLDERALYHKEISLEKDNK